MIDFPNSPSVGQVFNSGVGPLYVWDGTAWSIVGPTVSPTWQVIERRQFSAVSAVDFINLGIYRHLRLSGQIVLSSLGSLGWRSSVNNGVSFDAGASDYTFQAMSVNDTTFAGARNTGATYGQLVSSLTSGILDMYLDAFGINGRSCVSTQKATCFNGAGNTIFCRLDGASRQDTVARNALRIIPTTALTLSGDLTLEGLLV